eukprot:6187511-Pleurochrysis_carterae.AAC.1
MRCPKVASGGDSTFLCLGSGHSAEPRACCAADYRLRLSTASATCSARSGLTFLVFNPCGRVTSQPGLFKLLRLWSASLRFRVRPGRCAHTSPQLPCAGHNMPVPALPNPTNSCPLGRYELPHPLAAVNCESCS